MKEDNVFIYRNIIQRRNSTFLINIKYPNLQTLITSLSALTSEKDAIQSTLLHLDKNITALSTAIGVASSALNTPTGLLCMLRSISHLDHLYSTAGSSGGGGGGGGLLFELSLLNESALTLTEKNWTLVVAHVPDPQPAFGSSHVVRTFSLPSIASGSSWKRTFTLELSSLMVPSTVALFLSFNTITNNTTHGDVGTGTDASGGEILGVQSWRKLALLHAFKVDALHALQARTTSLLQSTSSRNRRVLPSSLLPTQLHRIGLQLGLPKSVVGIQPDSHHILDSLLKQGGCSVKNSLDSTPKKKEEPQILLDNNNTTTTLRNTPAKASIQGELVAENSASITEAAAVSVQAVPFHISTAASPQAVLDVNCESSSFTACLALHEAMLRRVLLLQEAVRVSQKQQERDIGHGILMSNGVLLPSLCNINADIDVNQLNTIEQKVKELKLAALEVRELAATRVKKKEAMIEFENLMKETRKVTNQLTIHI